MSTVSAMVVVFGADVEDHIQQVLWWWLPSYLYEVERNHSIIPGTLPLNPIRSSGQRRSKKFPEDQLPCLMIGSPGLVTVPIPDGGGYYTATWRINLAVEIVAGPNRRALELARWYALAVRAAIIQQQQDPGLRTPSRSSGSTGDQSPMTR